MVSSKLFTSCFALNLLGSSLAGTYHDQGNKVCKDYTIPLRVTFPVTGFNYPKWTTNYGLQDFITAATTRTARELFLPNVSKPAGTATGSYKIYGIVCSPKNHRANEKKLLVATHGIGFDRRYWDSEYDRSRYNFVDYAVNQGYSVFYYDRLGVGKSSRVSGFFNQPSTQAAILEQLTIALRQGKYTGKVGKPSRVIHVGHSFGSELSHYLGATSPSLTDGLILTGFDLNTTIINPAMILISENLRVARLLNPKAFSSFDNGYLANADIYTLQQGFFRAPFDRKALAYAFAIGQPSSIQEQLLNFRLIVDASAVKVPVQVVSAEFDYYYCSGDCRGSTEGVARASYPNARKFEFYQLAGSGHGINFAINAQTAYRAIGSFLEDAF